MKQKGGRNRILEKPLLLNERRGWEEERGNKSLGLAWHGMTWLLTLQINVLWGHVAVESFLFDFSEVVITII